MKLRPVSEWALYRWRFWIAYFLAGAVVGVFMFMRLPIIPPGISAGERASVITSAEVPFDRVPTDVVDIAYHALQKLSVEWLGITPWGVRLPSLVLGALTAIFIFLLLRRWFKPNVAVTAGAVLLTSAWFLSMVRLGTPVIMIPFWTSFLLLSATYVSQQTKNWRLWRVAFIFGGALALYTPYMLYLFIAGFLASLAQPHLRFLLRESSKLSLFIGGFFFLLLLGLLGWGIYNQPDQSWALLAIPQNLPDLVKFGQDLWLAGSSFLNPLNFTIGEIVTPAVNLATLALLLIGGARLLRDFHSIRSHLLLLWGALLLPLIGLNPNNLAVLYVPTMLVVAIGLQQIIRYWYRLFPLNPYARVFGLLPLALLIFSIVQFNYQRYFYGMLYSSQATQVFSRDPWLLQQELSHHPAHEQLTLVVAAEDISFYKLMVPKLPNALVVPGNDLPEGRKGTWIVADSQRKLVGVQRGDSVDNLLVSDAAQNARRFWVIQR